VRGCLVRVNTCDAWLRSLLHLVAGNGIFPNKTNKVHIEYRNNLQNLLFLQVKDSVKAAPAPSDAPQTAAARPGSNATTTPPHSDNGRKCAHYSWQPY